MQNLSLSLTWDGRKVRMVGTPDTPEWVAKDACEVLGLRGTGDLWKQIPEGEKGTATVGTPGGPQGMTTVKLPGLLRLILKSRKPEAERFQTWTVNEVLPSVLRHGCYPPPAEKPLSTARMFLASAKCLVALAERQDSMEARQHDIEARVQRIENDQRQTRAALLALPAPTVPAPERSLRAALNEMVRLAALRAGGGAAFQDCWNRAYLQLRDRCHFDAKRRAENEGRSALDVVDEAGLLPVFYAIVWDLFPVEAA